MDNNIKNLNEIRVAIFLLLIIVITSIFFYLNQPIKPTDIKYNNGNGLIKDFHQKGIITSYTAGLITIDTMTSIMVQDCNTVANATLGRGRFGTSTVCSPAYLKEQTMILNTPVNLRNDIQSFWTNNNIAGFTYSCFDKCKQESDLSGNCCYLESINIIK